MNILTVNNITKAYGERKLFDEASFFLQDGEKAGIIGINGTGKSTLLKMVAGLEEPDKGEIIRANNRVVRYLPQHPSFEPEETALQAVLRGNRKEQDTWNVEADAKAMLTRLGFVDFESKCGTLSGGQRKRLALVSALLSPADILILDEPTNHLAASMSAWLEDTLKKRRGALIMVTHDRYFLDSVSDRILEIDKGHIYSYAANYSGFLELKAAREEMAEASERKRQSLLKVELAWMQRGARARSTKQKAHIQRFEDLRQQEGPVKDAAVELGSVASRLGRTTVEIHGLCKSYGEKVLIKDFTYIFLKNDRVGFIGSNGCGKTTLMKLLTGSIQPDSGSIEIGQTVKLGYYVQEIGESMDPSKKVIDYVKDVAEYIETEDGRITASGMLERFLFAGEDQYGPVGKLSGGEKRRLNLLRVLMGAPNVLILDEPTNDLDIATLTILEDYLDHFRGIVIIVSHDRYFLDRTVRRILAFEENGLIKQYEGGYTDYAARLEWENAEEEAAGSGAPGREKEGKAPEKAKGTWKDSSSKKLKFTWQEQKDYETIEADIAALEAAMEQAEKEMLACVSDFVKLQELTEKKEKLQLQLDAKMERWMYLEELADKISRNGDED